MRILLPFLLVSGAHGGTAVGNPTGLTLDTAPGAGLAFTSAVADVASIEVTDLSGDTWTLEVDGPVDLLGGTRMEVPLADAARVRVNFAGPLTFRGAGAGDHSFALSLTVPSLEIELAAAPGEVPDAVLRLGAPDWATAATIGLTGPATLTGAVTVGADDPLHDALVDALTGGSALYGDDDGDGRCGDPGDGGDAEDDEDEEADDDAGECDGDLLGAAVR